MSIDQLLSSVPDIKPQSTGRLTNTPIVSAQIFADNSSSPPFLYTHLLENFTLEETLKAKVAFERMAALHHVVVSGYRADNGRFADAGFINACNASSQVIDFCGVNAHFQNGIAESNIRCLQSATRTALLHAMRHWPEMIALELWPLALLEITRVGNLLRFDKNGLPPLAHFARTDAIFNAADEHAFGCPVFVLDDALQQRSTIPKWNPRVRVGCYVGKSLFHASSISLIMNTSTGLISPQFHCVHDDNFSTIDAIRRGIAPPNWNSLVRSSSSLINTADFLKTTTWDITPPDHVPTTNAPCPLTPYWDSACPLIAPLLPPLLAPHHVLDAITSSSSRCFSFCATASSYRIGPIRTTPPIPYHATSFII